MCLSTVSNVYPPPLGLRHTARRGRVPVIRRTEAAHRHRARHRAAAGGVTAGRAHGGAGPGRRAGRRRRARRRRQGAHHAASLAQAARYHISY